VLVVSGTSVLLNLCRISAEGLLPELFHEVWIPPVVEAEFLRLAAARSRFRGIAMPAWVRVSPPVQMAPAVLACSGLDPGESAALSLALELCASAVLMDEAAGRRAARTLHVATIGIVGILLRAKDQGLIPAVRPLFARLREEAGLWLSPEFEAEVLRLAGE